MMKEATILTFDETEELRHKLDNIIGNLIDGKNEDGCSAVNACKWAIGQVKEIREMFD